MKDVLLVDSMKQIALRLGYNHTMFRGRVVLFIMTSAVLAGIGIRGFTQSAPELNDPRWGCYDAEPGHPTDPEKRAFVEAAGPTAQTLERNGGAPAAGLLAMAALESGFGFTRTALFARNPFGWKYTTLAAAGGRPAWILVCQPASDPGNRYVVFRDLSDSLSFVGGKLEQLARYGSVTARYHSDRMAGVPIEQAVRRWVRGIQAAGYNPNPRYTDNVIAVANDFVRPNSISSFENGLYKYSAALTNGTPTKASARDAAARELDATLQRARYMSQVCDADPVTNWTGYEGRPVRRCTYTSTRNRKTLSAVVYLLNPSATNIADRVANACKAVGLADNVGCGCGLTRWIVRNNGAQFPVAGFVIKTREEAGGRGPDPVYLEFRDGTTIVSTDKLNFTDTQLTIEAMEHAARAPVSETRVYARIANGTREDYRRAGGTAPVGTSPATDKDRRWPEVVRANELRAQDTGEDDLLRGVAMAMRAQLARN